MGFRNVEAKKLIENIENGGFGLENQWEEEFIDSIKLWIENNREITEKQFYRLQKIEVKNSEKYVHWHEKEKKQIISRYL